MPSEAWKLLGHGIGGFFYLHDFKNLARRWMSAEATEGPVSEERKKDVFEGWAEIRHNDGRIWHRKVLHFSWWELKSGDTERADMESEMVKDYLVVAVNEDGWKGY